MECKWKINIVPCDKANKLIKVFSFLFPCWCLNEKVWQGTFSPPFVRFCGVCFAGSRIKIDIHLGGMVAVFFFLVVFFFPARAHCLRGFSSLATNSLIMFLPWSLIWQYNYIYLQNIYYKINYLEYGCQNVHFMSIYCNTGNVLLLLLIYRYHTLN